MLNEVDLSIANALRRAMSSLLPIVTFDDEIGQGYGAYGKATIDQNPDSPTYGQVTSIYITSKGENYPASDEEDPLYIGGVVIDDPGLGYKDTDT